MGIFFESKPATPVVKEALLFALEKDPSSIDVESEASARARQVSEEIKESRTFKTGRFLGALAIFAVLAAGAVAAEVTGLTEATKTLWGLAPTVFGIIVGLVTGESAHET